MNKCIALALFFAICAAVQAEENSSEYTTNLFKLMDVNKDGKVTRSEFVAYRRERAKKDRKSFDSKAAEQEFRKKDQNKDNALTREEFMASAKDK
ncbi:MAG: EF-hand domain-containing protein [Pontiellaceae bacterium]|nr:EF-hand domain-containing protein [Pontiellaceae bacterium]MBN2785115.1 EF-hand domain-containing protein [Pontiellaceae bacterium]